MKKRTYGVAFGVAAIIGAIGIGMIAVGVSMKKRGVK